MKKDLLKRIGMGILDSIPVVATIKANVQSAEAGTGKIDWIRLATSILVISSGLLFLYGKIKGIDTFSIEELKELYKLLGY